MRSNNAVVLGKHKCHAVEAGCVRGPVMVHYERAGCNHAVLEVCRSVAAVVRLRNVIAKVYGTRAHIENRVRHRKFENRLARIFLQALVVVSKQKVNVVLNPESRIIERQAKTRRVVCRSAVAARQHEDLVRKLKKTAI